MHRIVWHRQRAGRGSAHQVDRAIIDWLVKNSLIRHVELPAQRVVFVVVVGIFGKERLELHFLHGHLDALSAETLPAHATTCQRPRCADANLLLATHGAEAHIRLEACEALQLEAAAERLALSRRCSDLDALVLALRVDAVRPRELDRRSCARTHGSAWRGACREQRGQGKRQEADHPVS